MEDSYRHKGLRNKLVATLKAKGIDNLEVLQAIQVLPRHYFLDKAFEEKAYIDEAFPIGKDQTISQPYTVAYQTSLLNIKKREKVMEIGTGSGYQAAILSMLGARVYTIERHESLHKKASLLLKQIGLRGIRTYFRDGMKGLAEYAPFDKIIVTAGIEELPENLLQQLKVGGILVIPVGRKVLRMKRITHLSEGKFKEEVFDKFKFVPFLPGTVK